MAHRIERRTFLKGAAGALLPLPALEAMASPGATPAPPVRFVALFKPNGVHPPSWNIEGGGERDFKFSPMMTPFAGHRDQLLILDGMGDSGFSSHQAAARRFLSGGAGRDRWGRASVDQVIAKRIGRGTPHRSLELTTEGLFTQNPTCSYISYNELGQPIPRESDPQLVFDRLFRDPLSNPERRKETSSLLDRVREHAQSLSRRVGREDQRTLDQYLTSVRETERRIASLDAAPRPAVDPAAPTPPPAGATLDERVDVMLDLMALALWTDATRCATFMLGNDNSRMIFDFLGVKKEHHYLSHYFRNFSRENLGDLHKICLWHTQKFNHLLDRMQSYKGPEGSLLDHSAVLFGAGMGESDAHTAQRIPTVLAGKAGGRLKTGRYLRYARNHDLTDLHQTLLSIFDAPTGGGSEGAEPARVGGLDGSPFDAYRETPFASSLEIRGDEVAVQGRLQFSTDLGRANQFFIEVAGRPRPVRLEVPFKTMEQNNLPFHCGTPVVIRGTGKTQEGETVVTAIREFRPLGAEKPR